MSRTVRRKRPRMKLGHLLQYKDGTVPDGTSQYATGSCHNHGGCPYCEGNRLHKHKRTMLIEDEFN